MPKMSVVITREKTAFCREGKCLDSDQVENLLRERFFFKTFPKELTFVFVIHEKDFDLIKAYIKSIDPTLNLFYRKRELTEILTLVSEQAQ